MKLIKTDGNANWIIVDEVSDDEAAVLRACGFEYVDDVDANGFHGEDNVDYPYEIWWYMMHGSMRTLREINSIKGDEL